jgi:hypothetical protein
MKKKLENSKIKFIKVYKKIKKKSSLYIVVNNNKKNLKFEEKKKFITSNFMFLLFIKI